MRMGIGSPYPHSTPSYHKLDDYIFELAQKLAIVARNIRLKSNEMIVTPVCSYNLKDCYLINSLRRQQLGSINEELIRLRGH
jgi:hypothetical protein